MKRVRAALWVGGVLLIGGLPVGLGIVPVVEFPWERIDVHVYPDHVVVEGEYLYRNPLPIPVVQGLSIPLPVDADHPEPIALEVVRVGRTEEPIQLISWFGIHRFRLSFDAREEVRIRVRYRQHAPAENARYILTTTQGWWRPLEHGIYRVHCNGVEIAESNYTLTGKSTGEVGFDRRDFMPTADWTIAWRETK